MIFHHIGVATNDLFQSLVFVRENFDILDCTDTIYDAEQDAHLIMIKTKDLNIELVSGNVVKSFISKKQSYYHICYEVNDIEKAINSFSYSILAAPPKRAILFNNRKVAFLLTPIGLIELLESDK
jgi:methylmalonyl-CoA/ethylmalonyl-CoA epimerase